MAKKQKQLPDLSSHDPLVPIDLTSIGGNGDPCFGKAYDLSTKSVSYVVILNYVLTE